MEPYIKSITLITGSTAKAMLEGEPDTEVFGSTDAETVGRLVLANQERLGIRVQRVLPAQPKTPIAIALEEFNSVCCPGCGQSKKIGFWFCELCWNAVKIDKKIKDALWQRRVTAERLSQYYRAKAILREGRKDG